MSNSLVFKHRRVIELLVSRSIEQPSSRRLPGNIREHLARVPLLKIVFEMPVEQGYEKPGSPGRLEKRMG